MYTSELKRCYDFRIVALLSPNHSRIIAVAMRRQSQSKFHYDHARLTPGLVPSGTRSSLRRWAHSLAVSTHRTSRDVTTEATWESSTPSAATIDNTGLATDVGVGTTTITASLKGDFGTKTDSATLSATGHDLQTLTIVPTDQTLFALGETAQFIAVGTFNSAPVAQDMISQVTWHIVDVDLATINSAGLVTAINCPTTPPLWAHA